MHDHPHRFSPEHIARLENPERQRIQPAGRLVDWIAALAPARLLDVGVGIGYLAIPLARALPEARISGMDVAPEMLGLLGDRLEAAGLADRIAPVESAADGPDPWPFEDGSLDLVLGVNLYHELDDRPRFLAEARRVLASGGRLVLCDGSLDRPSEYGPPRDHLLPMETIQAELVAAGLEIAEAPPLYDHFYTLSCTHKG